MYEMPAVQRQQQVPKHHHLDKHRVSLVNSSSSSAVRPGGAPAPGWDVIGADIVARYGDIWFRKLDTGHGAVVQT